MVKDNHFKWWIQMNRKDKKNLKLDKEDVDYKHRSTTVFQNFSTHTTEMKCMEMKDSPFRNRPWFLCVCSTSLLKTLWEKDILLVTSNFSFFPQCYLSILRAFCLFHQIWNCHLQTFSVLNSLKFVIGKGLKMSSSFYFRFTEQSVWPRCHFQSRDDWKFSRD